MKKMLRSVLVGVLMGLMCLMLSGCGMFKSIDDLYALPALPEEYSQLQESIQSVIDELGAEYASINYGNYTSTIQLLDMDGDGIQETAAVFLRVSVTTEEKPMRVCLFRRDADGTYQLTHTVQGDGTSIHSVTYEDLTGDGVRELIVSWQMSAVYALSAYRISSGGASELLNTSYNERYLTVDMDADGCKEIVVFHQRSSDTESNRAEYYRYQDGAMIMASVAPLSAAIRDVTDTEAGILSDGMGGIYVTCETEQGLLTDILVLRDGTLQNVTMDLEVGSSQVTARTYTEVGAADINRDGIMEIPLPVQVAKVDESTAANSYIVYWRQFNSQGVSTLLSTATYHSITDGWYLTLPSNWLGKITVSRDDSRSMYGERAVVFYYWPDTETTTPEPFLTIYRLTGENRQARARLAGRVTLYNDNSAIYSAKLNADVWDCELEASELSALFSLITPEWSSN